MARKCEKMAKRSRLPKLNGISPVRHGGPPNRDSAQCSKLLLPKDPVPGQYGSILLQKSEGLCFRGPPCIVIASPSTFWRRLAFGVQSALSNSGLPLGTPEIASFRYYSSSLRGWWCGGVWHSGGSSWLSGLSGRRRRLSLSDGLRRGWHGRVWRSGGNSWLNGRSGALR